MPRTGSVWVDSVCLSAEGDEPVDGRLNPAMVDLAEQPAEVVVRALRLDLGPPGPGAWWAAAASAGKRGRRGGHCGHGAR